jgi:glycosyltransferase involved in cell wall biosynthesis
VSTRHPRVLQVALSLNPGGTERLVIELSRRLHREVPMAVCCLDQRGAWASELITEGIQITELRRPRGFSPRLGQGVAAAAARHRATVLHCHHYSPFIYGALARLWRPGMRLIYTEHGRLSDAPPSPKRRVANVMFGIFPNAVFAVSRELRDHMVQEGFSPTRAGVIYNGIDLGAVPRAVERGIMRQELGVSDDMFVIGTIARLDPVKDLLTLIRAVARLGATAMLLVIGDGTEMRTLEQEAAAAGISDRVRFLGQRNDARRWLAGCDVYANSSISEGVSLTILEAMAAALPVVATRVGGTPEVLDDASGILVPARDPGTLSNALAALHVNPARRLVMGDAARRRVETHFTIDRMVSEYRRVYERLT